MDEKGIAERVVAGERSVEAKSRGLGEVVDNHGNPFAVYLEDGPKGVLLRMEGRTGGKFEWYLSGAIPEAYQALDDLDQSYPILRIMKMERKVTWVPVR